MSNPTPSAAIRAAAETERIGAAVCGVDCRPGDGLCNGYCHDARIKEPPSIILASPRERAMQQVTQGAVGNGTNIGALECQALLDELTALRGTLEEAAADTKLLDTSFTLHHEAGPLTVSGRVLLNTMRDADVAAAAAREEREDV